MSRHFFRLFRTGNAESNPARPSSAMPTAASLLHKNHARSRAPCRTGFRLLDTGSIPPSRNLLANAVHVDSKFRLTTKAHDMQVCAQTDFQLEHFKVVKKAFQICLFILAFVRAVDAPHEADAVTLHVLPEREFVLAREVPR